MLRTIKLSVDPVYIDPGSSLSHTGTSYQVSTTPDFNTPANIIINNLNDTVNLESYSFDYAIPPDAPLYIRTKYHLSDGTSSNWSNIIELNSNQVGMKSSDTVLSTPNISANLDYATTITGELVIELSSMDVISGSGTINAVSWLVTDTDGKELYSLPKSPDMLSVIRLPLNQLGNANTLVVSATTHTDTNAVSNPARTLVVRDDRTVVYFNAKLIPTLYANAITGVEYTPNEVYYAKLDIQILDGTNNVVEAHTNLPIDQLMFMGTNIVVGVPYTVQARGIDELGTKTPWVTIYTGAAYPYSPITWAPTLTYNTTNVGFGGYINFDGMSTQSIEADEDGTAYLAIPGTNQLLSYRCINGTMRPTGHSLDLGVNGLEPIPNITMKRRYDGGYILDHTAINGTNIESVFIHLDYNPVTKQLTNTQSFVRADESIGTGATNSCVMMPNNTMYYIPGAMVVNGSNVQPEMRLFDIATNAIIDHIPLPSNLPAGITENICLAGDANNDLYLFGGTGGPVQNAAHAEVVHTLLNKDIFKYDKITKTWSNILTVTINNPDSYRFRMQTLKNGDIYIIDATPGIIGTPIRESFIYHPATNTITATLQNNPSQEHIGVVISLRDGDVVTMSSTPELVEAYSMLTSAISNANLVNNPIAESQPVRDLVVGINEVVYVRDPYRYDSITINGNNMGDSGKLVWIKDTGTITYYYNDLIVTRNMTIPAATAQVPQPVYNRVVTVGDAVLTIL